MMDANKLVVTKNIGVQGDRNFAFVRLLDKELAFKFQNHKEFRNIVNYFSLKSSPIFNIYSFRIHGKNIALYKQDRKIISIEYQDFDSLQEIVEAFKKEEVIEDQKIFLLHNQEAPFFDTVKNNTISLINLHSLRDLEYKNDISIDAERFRANIYVEELDPWIEQSWIGKQIRIDGKTFEVFASIPRCKATHYPYGSQHMDYNVPQLLQKTYGHIDLGIYLRPSSDMTISLQSKIIV